MWQGPAGGHGCCTLPAISMLCLLPGISMRCLPPTCLDSSIWFLAALMQAFRGTGARAQAVAAKLLAGQPVHVAVVGGSVTWGQGAIHGGNFGVRFFNWVNATWPSPHHRFTNAAKPAVTSSLYAICGGSMVPKVGGVSLGEWYGGACLCVTSVRTFIRCLQCRDSH